MPFKGIVVIDIIKYTVFSKIIINVKIVLINIFSDIPGLNLQNIIN